MSERAPLPETLLAPDAGRVLLLAPHPDDDVLGCGGTACLHVEQGDPVRVVVAYDGAAGDPKGHFDKDEIAALRRNEAREGGRILGLSDYDFWGYPEGHEPGPEEFRAGAERVAVAVREWRPDVVYAPWAGEYHLDHCTLARVARAGLALSGFDGAAWGYEVWTPLVPTRIVDVTRVHEKKAAALKKHATQLEYGDIVHYGLGLNAHRSVYLEGGLYGEAFRPLGPPDASDLELVR